MENAHPRIEAVRRFGRFYTRQIGLLSEGFLDSAFSLTEARVIYEIAHQADPTATTIATELGLDPGYMSRILRSLSRRGFVEKNRSSEDRRRVLLTLSPEGRAAFERLDAGATGSIRTMLAHLPLSDQEKVVGAMATIERLLATDPHSPSGTPFTLRPHRPGDLGWVVQRHGEIYSELRGYDDTFEAMCADIAARFLVSYDPACERSWIAERDGVRVGAVFLLRRSKTVGQLRFLFVDAHARGLGIGARLVSECVGHARHVGYKKMTLFTVRGLDSARKLYEAEGFQLVHEEDTELWGQRNVEQRWDLRL